MVEEKSNRYLAVLGFGEFFQGGTSRPKSYGLGYCLGYCFLTLTNIIWIALRIYHDYQTPIIIKPLTLNLEGHGLQGLQL
jgi:hypothetical protein